MSFSAKHQVLARPQNSGLVDMQTLQYASVCPADMVSMLHTHSKHMLQLHLFRLHAGPVQVHCWSYS